MMRKLAFILTVMLGALTVCAQKLSPITWNVSVEDNSAESAVIKFSAAVEHGWHLYGFDLPDDGPNATSIKVEYPEGVTPEGGITPERAPIEKFDPVSLSTSHGGIPTWLSHRK